MCACVCVVCVYRKIMEGSAPVLGERPLSALGDGADSSPGDFHITIYTHLAHEAYIYYVMYTTHPLFCTHDHIILLCFIINADVCWRGIYYTIIIVYRVYTYIYVSVIYSVYNIDNILYCPCWQCLGPPRRRGCGGEG